MGSPEQVVRDFLSLMEHHRADEAVGLLHDDVEWRNTGLPTLRGKQRVARVVRAVEKSPVGFAAELHQVAVDGAVVRSERTDVLSLGRWRTTFRVRGTFEITDGRIRLWEDAFGWGAVLGGSVTGLGRALRPRPRRR